MSLMIYGCSDDLIEIEGDIEEEFNTDETVLVTSTGHVFHIEFGNGWTIKLLRGNSYVLTWSTRLEFEEDQVVTLHQDVEWVVADNRFEKRRR